jgi:hypothetical protein
MTGIALLTEWYRDTSEKRQEELRLCLKRNAENSHISEIYLCGSKEDLASAPTHDKIRRVTSNARMTFNNFLTLAAAALPGRICIVANGDIYFDETLALVSKIELEETVHCLSRWDLRVDGGLDFSNTDRNQDAWIFKAPLLVSANFYPGLPGCDNRLAWLIYNEALRPVANPSLSIRACHAHLSNKRNYRETDRITGPYLYVPPTRIE